MHIGSKNSLLLGYDSGECVDACEEQVKIEMPSFSNHIGAAIQFRCSAGSEIEASCARSYTGAADSVRVLGKKPKASIKPASPNS